MGAGSAHIEWKRGSVGVVHRFVNSGCEIFFEQIEDDFKFSLVSLKRASAVLLCADREDL